MTNVLLVNHDVDLADLQADSLRRRGYSVTQCMGPVGASCPILGGRPCELADKVDVLVYDAWVTQEPDGAQRLIEGLRDIHPDLPIVLCANGLEPSWVETTGPHRVTPLVAATNWADLATSIESALLVPAR